MTNIQVGARSPLSGVIRALMLALVVLVAGGLTFCFAVAKDTIGAVTGFRECYGTTAPINKPIKPASSFPIYAKGI